MSRDEETTGREDRTTGRDDPERWEEELSAFLDGELDAEREAALREALARDPALAARLEALRRVDAGLRATPAPPVPADLRARLQARIEARESAPAPRAAGARPAPPRRSSAPRRRRLWTSGLAAAAVAAALALMLLVSRPVRDLPPERVAEAPGPAPRDADPTPEAARGLAPDPLPEETTVAELAPEETSVAELVPGDAELRAPDPLAPDDVEIPGPEPRLDGLDDLEIADLGPEPAPEGAAPLPEEIAAASDEELEIALEWEVLEDLEMLERLAVLEAMLELERRGQG